MVADGLAFCGASPPRGLGLWFAPGSSKYGRAGLTRHYGARMLTHDVTGAVDISLVEGGVSGQRNWSGPFVRRTPAGPGRCCGCGERSPGDVDGAAGTDAEGAAVEGDNPWPSARMVQVPRGRSAGSVTWASCLGGVAGRLRLRRRAPATALDGRYAGRARQGHRQPDPHRPRPVHRPSSANYGA